MPSAFSYLTSKEYLGLPPEKLSVTVFAGEDDVPRDDESAAIWESLGIPRERIHFMPRSDNWWGPAGETGPCGPDTEMFIDTGKAACSEDCKPGCHCGKYIEIWNDVFMQYNKQKDGSFAKLDRKCVDTGMGLERTIAMLQGKKSVYETEIFRPLIACVEGLCGKKFGDSADHDVSIRIICDHTRAATFILGDERGVPPSNVGAGYVLRRLIRRAVRHGRKLGIDGLFLSNPAEIVIDQFSGAYPELAQNRDFVLKELVAEEQKFLETLKKGEVEFEKMLPNLLKNPQKTMSGRLAFKLYDTYGFPIELTEELAGENGLAVNRADLMRLSRSIRNYPVRAVSRFSKAVSQITRKNNCVSYGDPPSSKGASYGPGDHVGQKGSNITADRMRFDLLSGTNDGGADRYSRKNR